MTDNPTPKLMPCPFCGGNAEVFYNDYSDYPDHWYYDVVCEDCIQESAIKEDAIKAWNTRAPVPNPETSSGSAMSATQMSSSDADKTREAFEASYIGDKSKDELDRYWDGDMYRHVTVQTEFQGFKNGYQAATYSTADELKVVRDLLENKYGKDHALEKLNRLIGDK